MTRGLALPAVLLVAALLLPGTARACSYFSDVVDLAGSLILVDVETGVERRIRFDEVYVESNCGIASELDVAADRVMLQLYGEVRFYDLAGNPLQTVTLGSRFAQSPRLDGGYVYYFDRDNESLERHDLATGSNELLAANIPTHDLTSFEVSEGIAAWLVRESDGFRLFVYDAQSRNYVLSGAEVPDALVPATDGWGGIGPDIVGVRGNNLTVFVAYRDLYTYDYAANRTELLSQLHVNTTNVAQDGSRVVYTSADGLRVLDLARNTTGFLRPSSLGSNLDVSGNVAAYDFYETVRRPSLLWLVALVVVVACVGIIARSVRSRRKAHRQTGRGQTP